MSSPFTDLDRPPLSERMLQRAVVVPGALWRRVVVRASTASTNADVAELARDDEPEGLVVVAEQQSDGRGRRGRTWVSPPRAGLMVSVLLRPGVADPARDWAGVPSRDYGWLPLIAGLALLDTVTRLAQVDAALKWPNDLLVRVDDVESKCAGILAEVVSGPIPSVVLGIGLNVTTRADELPETSGMPPTSLKLAGATITDRDPLLRALLRGFADRYDRWRLAGGDVEASGLLQEYRAGCATIGRQVRVLVPDGEVTGEVTTVDADGHLVIRTPDGERRVAAGDVVHVR